MAGEDGQRATIHRAMTPRDTGLVRGVGALGLAAAVANMTIGGGIFALPAAMAKAVGPTAPLYYLLCAGAVGAVALCFAEAGSRIAVSGGISGGVEAAFGRYFGFMTAVMLWIGAVLAAGGITAAIADALGSWLPIFHTPAWRTGFILALTATFAAINIRGVRAGSGLVGVTFLAKLIPLAVLVVVGALHVQPALLSAGAPPRADIGRAMILGVFAFMGMETALGVSGEVRNPGRNVPLGLLGAMAAVTALYVAIQLVCEGLLGPALADAADPLAKAMATVSPALGLLLAVGAAISRLGYLTSDMLSAPRFLFRLGEDGFLPKPFAAVLAKERTPWVAILTHAAILAGLGISGQFEALAALSTLVVVIPYAVGSAAAVVLQRRGVAEEGPPLNFRALPLVAGFAILAMAWIAAQAKPDELIAIVLFIGVASMIYLLGRFMGRRRAAPPAQ